MSEVKHHDHRRGYIIIFVALALLTLLEIWVPEWNVEYGIKAALLTLLACIKAYLVAYYYMHLNEETKWMKFIAMIPLSAVIYTLVVCLESVYR